jgi:hypothetical protein
MEISVRHIKNPPDGNRGEQLKTLAIVVASSERTLLNIFLGNEHCHPGRNEGTRAPGIKVSSPVSYRLRKY